MPSPEALSKFKRVAHDVIEPTPLILSFRREVRCFSPSDTLSTVLDVMRQYDHSQVVVRDGTGKLHMLTVEGITRWLADNAKGNQPSPDKAILDGIIGLEPPGAFQIKGPEKSIFDAVDAFRNSIHSESTRLYAVVITENGGDWDAPIGFVTPWDLVHNPRLGQ